MASEPGFQPSEAIPPSMRRCPTIEGDYRALIVHCIDVATCMRRQRELYHKCHRCLYRGRPATFFHTSPAAEVRRP